MMKVQKNDPMYYKNQMAKLIKEAKENGLKVYGDKQGDNTYIYFEAHEYEIWSVNVPGKEIVKCNQCNNEATDSGSGLCEECEEEVMKEQYKKEKELMYEVYEDIIRSSY